MAVWKKDKWFTVADLYNLSVAEDDSLLPQLNPVTYNWWPSDVTFLNRLFYRRYRTFRPIMQDPSLGELADVNAVFSDWLSDVADFLAVNSKRYNELYKLVNAQFAANPANDFQSTETETETRNLNKEEVLGEREDSNDRTIGSKTTTDNTSLGARSDSATNTRGSATDTHENKIAGFNSGTYNNSNQSTNVYGQRQDTSSTTTGAQSNSNTRLEGSQTVGDVYNKGEQTNQTSDTGTIRKEKSANGFTGRRSVAENLTGYEEFWGDFSFYFKIFDDIANEFLLV